MYTHTHADAHAHTRMQSRASSASMHECVLNVCAISHVLLKDVCNQGSLTDIPSNSPSHVTLRDPCREENSVTEADIFSHARASCSAAELAAEGVFGSQNSGL